MKVENMLKIKEEFDYKSMCRRLETQIDKLIAENERQQKACEDEIERATIEAQQRISEAEINYKEALEVILEIYVCNLTFFLITISTSMLLKSKIPNNCQRLDKLHEMEITYNLL